MTHTPWIQIANGKAFEPLNPKPEDITIEVIAAALSKICRFSGHTKRFYSVAEHSCHVMRLLRPKLQLVGLLHDAHEAYTGFGDVVSPMKTHAIHDLEGSIDVVIAQRFGFNHALFYSDEIRWADLTMLATERRDLLLPSERDWEVELPKPADFRLDEGEFNYRQVEQNFLRMFYNLTKGEPLDERIL